MCSEVRNNSLVALTTRTCQPYTIVGFSFGKGRQSHPGGTNYGLAYSIYKLIKLYEQLHRIKPQLCLQEEIARALKKQIQKAY